MFLVMELTQLIEAMQGTQDIQIFDKFVGDFLVKAIWNVGLVIN
jgi:hypothetical protein